MLFGKPYDVMRATFARKRLESDAHFGIHTVEFQIERELVSSVPTDNVPWSRVLNRDTIDWSLTGRPTLELIDQLCTPVPATDQLGDFVPLCKALHPERSQLYIGENFALVLTYDVAGATGYQFGICGGLVRNELTLVKTGQSIAFHRPLLADLLLSEWKLGRIKWDTARAFLCGLAADSAKKLVEGAKCDFDQAVAVSKDLTRLVEASHVLVMFSKRDGHRPRLYRADAFKERKITRVVHRRENTIHTDRVRFVDDYFREWTLSVFTGRFESSLDWVPKRYLEPFQHMVRLADATVFVTQAEHCQNPLPEDVEQLL